MNYYPEFAQLLDRHLTEADRSAAWLAQRLGVNPATVTRWRNGDTRPREPETIVRVADVLGIHETQARQQLMAAAGYGYVAAVGVQIEQQNSAHQPSEPAAMTDAPVALTIRPQLPPPLDALWPLSLPLAGLVALLYVLIRSWSVGNGKR